MVAALHDEPWKDMCIWAQNKEHTLRMWHGLALICMTKVERCSLTINLIWVTDRMWPPEKLLPSCSALDEAWFGLAAYWLVSGSHLMTWIETDPAWTPFWIICSPSFLKPSSLIEKAVSVVQSWYYLLMNHIYGCMESPPKFRSSD